MKNKFIPFYREKELYTLFYDQSHNRLYKFQHRNKSFGVFFLFMIMIIYGSSFLDSIYQKYHSVLFDIVLFFVAVGITYYIARKFYQYYYIEETKRSIILDQNTLEKCATKGTKQFRIEFCSSIVSLLIGVVFFIIFFVTSRIRPLVIGCICMAVIFILIYMKPLARKRVLKGFRDRNIEIE